MHCRALNRPAGCATTPSARFPRVVFCSRSGGSSVPTAASVSNAPSISGAATSEVDFALRDVRVVLVSPKSESNVGAVARCCANFEVAQLWIVDPRCNVMGAEALRLACNAEDVLEKAMVVSTLDEALAATSGSIGFTRRSGATRYVHASLAHMVSEFPASLPLIPQPTEEIGAGLGVTALVFGREESGLREEELRSVSFACAIPSGRRQGSLNLSHAVSVILAEIFQRRWLISQGDAQLLQLPNSIGLNNSNSNDQEAPKAASSDQDEALLPASTQEVDLLLKKVSAIAVVAGISGEESHGGAGNHGRRRLPVGNLRAVFQRAKVNRKESRSLHGLASAVLNLVDPGNELEQKKNSRRTRIQNEERN